MLGKDKMIFFTHIKLLFQEKSVWRICGDEKEAQHMCPE